MKTSRCAKTDRARDAALTNPRLGSKSSKRTLTEKSVEPRQWTRSPSPATTLPSGEVKRLQSALQPSTPTGAREKIARRRREFYRKLAEKQSCRVTSEGGTAEQQTFMFDPKPLIPRDTHLAHLTDSTRQRRVTGLGEKFGPQLAAPRCALPGPGGVTVAASGKGFTTQETVVNKNFLKSSTQKPQVPQVDSARWVSSWEEAFHQVAPPAGAYLLYLLYLLY